MSVFLLFSILGLSLAGRAAGPTILVTDASGVAQRQHAPVSMPVDLAQLLGKQAKPDRLRLVELKRGEPKQGVEVPVQFEPASPGSLQGQLWWLLPPSAERERRFALSLAGKSVAASVTVQPDATKNYFDVREGPQPVLRYNQGTVPVPAGVGTNFARGDYIMPLFGLSGEVLTDDYPPDHPHHRALGWSWPVTRWGKEVRDIWAVVGVWSRPVAMRRVETGPVFALLEAENVWKWGDTNPIVREEVLIRTFRQSGTSRLLDIEVRLTALADGVAIGGRPHGGYGGFGLRAMPAEQRKITRHSDPPEASPRRSWLDYSGVFAGGKGPSGIAIFEGTSNLFYPNTLLEYPTLNYVMPAFPGEREVPLAKDKALVLRHRLWIHAGMAEEQGLTDIWAAYANPPTARIQTP